MTVHSSRRSTCSALPVPPGAGAAAAAGGGADLRRPNIAVFLMVRQQIHWR